VSEGTRDFGLGGGEHPAVEVWRDYRARRLPEEREEELQEHLVGCHWCQELVLELARVEKEGGNVASLEAAASWRRVRGRLVEEEVLPAVAERKGLPMWVGWAAAACFVAFVVAVWDDRAVRRRHQQPIAFEETETGEPKGAKRGPDEVILLSGGRTAAISLVVPGDLPAGDYVVEFIDPDGKRVKPSVSWRYDGGDGDLTIGFPRLPKGPFEVRIVGPGDKVWAVYSVASH
jgi:hypothetical protein